MVELILQESTRIVRQRPGLPAVEHRLGFVMANAGIDQSNVEHGEGGADGAGAEGPGHHVSSSSLSIPVARRATGVPRRGS